MASSTPQPTQAPETTETRSQYTASRLAALLMALFGASAVAGIFLGGFALPIVGSLGVVANAGVTTFEELPEEFDIAPPSQISTMLAADGSVMARFYAENRIAVPSDQVTDWLKEGTVSIEDRRFFEHKGVDAEGLARAFINNAAGGDLQGASTLTQQYVRNVLIERGRVEGDKSLVDDALAQTPERKIREIKYSISLEKKLSKDEILEGYMNIAQYGPSVYGVEAAARHYFSKSANDLTLAESALLAGMPQSPNGHDPLTNPESARNRRDAVLAAMLRDGHITQAQHDEARAIPIADMLRNVSTTPQGCGLAGDNAYFCSWVTNELLRAPEFGKTYAERQRLLLRGGLTIHTTMDPVKQAAAVTAVTGAVPKGDSSNLKMALSSVEPGTGKIQALAQNTDFGVDPGNAYVTETSYNADVLHGGESGFGTGSTFKAFTLAQWYLEGKGGYDTVGGKYFIPKSKWKIPCAPDVAADFPIVDIGGQRGASSVVRATQLSTNAAFADMASQMNLCDISNLAASLGVTQKDGTPFKPNPSFVLGTGSATPLAMTNAFATFAARGTYCKPIAITEVRDYTGKEYEVPDAECHQALPPSVADKMNQTLAQVVAHESARVGIGRPAAGKTGTTNNYSNTWFVGYTPQLAAGVWLGHSEGNKPVQNVTINGRYYNIVYGSMVSAPTWRAYMREAVADMPVQRFTPINLGGKPTEEPSEEPSESATPSPGTGTGTPPDGTAPQVPDPNQQPAQPAQPVQPQPQQPVQPAPQPAG
ncbi:MAG: transglycosylase domain-containing protein [Actinomycetaceae bacterium]|nr:transglycosylase domain-containing protein [Actinomycetaceae bacterium]